MMQVMVSVNLDITARDRRDVFDCARFYILILIAHMFTCFVFGGCSQCLV